MFKNILVPVDGSAPSDNALRMAISLAKEGGGRLRLVHVVDHTAFMTGYDPAGGSSGQLFSAMRDSGMQILREGTTAAQAQGLPADHVLVEQVGVRLGEAVAEAAAGFGADLIVVGTHGRSGPSRLLLGSGAEQIIRLAAVPVLVTRDPAQAA